MTTPCRSPAAPRRATRPTRRNSLPPGPGPRIRGLREPYGKIAVLYFLQHKDTAEIAALTGRPQTTVNNQLWRAKLLLRRQINERRLKE